MILLKEFAGWVFLLRDLALDFSEFFYFCASAIDGDVAVPVCCSGCLRPKCRRRRPNDERPGPHVRRA